MKEDFTLPFSSPAASISFSAAGFSWRIGVAVDQCDVTGGLSWKGKALRKQVKFSQSILSIARELSDLQCMKNTLLEPYHYVAHPFISQLHSYSFLAHYCFSCHYRTVGTNYFKTDAVITACILRVNEISCSDSCRQVYSGHSSQRTALCKFLLLWFLKLGFKNTVNCLSHIL